MLGVHTNFNIEESSRPAGEPLDWCGSQLGCVRHPGMEKGRGPLIESWLGAWGQEREESAEIDTSQRVSVTSLICDEKETQCAC